MTPSAHPYPHLQRGVALIIALIMLMIMSLLAVASLRGTAQQERMSTNALDRELAFQAAEAALRVGEARVARGDAAITDLRNGTTGGACSSSAPNSGLCPKPDPDWDQSKQRWNDPKTHWHQLQPGADLGGGVLSALQATVESKNDNMPAYIIEFITGNGACADGKTGCVHYRVTAKGNGKSGTGRASVILQSIYAFGGPP
jgi:type IV pilus assembly protein PilX